MFLQTINHTKNTDLRVNLENIKQGNNLPLINTIKYYMFTWLRFLPPTEKTLDFIKYRKLYKFHNTKGPKIRYSLPLLLTIHLYKNNTGVTFTTFLGRVILRVTPTKLKLFRKWQKTRDYALIKMVRSCFGQLYNLRYKFCVSLRIRFLKTGHSFWMSYISKNMLRAISRSLAKAGVMITSIYEIFSVVHNGCKQPSRKHKRRGRVKRGWKRSTNAKKIRRWKWYIKLLSNYKYLI